MSFSIITTGKPGGCKTTTNSRILYELKKVAWLDPALHSDRILLEEAVMKDVHYEDPSQHKYGEVRGRRGLIGKRSIMFDGDKQPGQKVVEVLDPEMLNEIHDEMVRLAVAHHREDGMLFEYATGNDVVRDGKVLDQSGDSLVERFRRIFKTQKAENRILVVEVDASYNERMRRNRGRIDGIDQGTLDLFFQDGGELRESGYNKFRELGIQFHYINNDYNDLYRFTRELEELTLQAIHPIIEGVMTARTGKESFR